MNALTGKSYPPKALITATCSSKYLSLVFEVISLTFKFDHALSTGISINPSLPASIAL